MPSSALLLRILLPIFFTALFLPSFGQTDSLRWYMDSLSKLVADIDPHTDGFRHQWIVDQDLPELVTYTLNSESLENGRPADLLYKFNLADLDVAALGPMEKGKGYAVPLRVVNGKKLLSVFEQGKAQDHTDKLDIPALEKKDAETLASILRAAIPLAKSVLPVHLRLPEGELALREIATQLPTVVRGKLQLDQSFALSCQTVFKVSEKITSKSVITHFQFLLNLSDLDPEGIEIEVSGNEVDVVVPVRGGKRLVRQMQDDEFREYENDIRIATPDVEHARQLAYIMPEAIAWCAQEEQAMPFPKQKMAAQKMVQSLVDSVAFFTETVYQKVQWQESSQCLMDLAVRTKKYRKTVEERYTIDLGQIHAERMEVAADLKRLYLKLQVEEGADGITYAKGYRPQKRVDGVKIYFLHVQDAKAALKAISVLAESCR